MLVLTIVPGAAGETFGDFGCFTDPVRRLVTLGTLATCVAFF